jgi:exodeoxyribonuclease VIII
MTEQDYFAIEAINWSRLKLLRLSPKHFQHALTTTREDSAPLRIGRAVHAFLLDPDEFVRSFVCYKDGIRRGRAWDDFCALHAGKTILNEAEWTQALGTATAVDQDERAHGYLAHGLKEAGMTWTDEETGLLCKARVDFAGERLVDLKSTGRIEPRQFMQQSATLGYHGQLAFYQDGLRANGIDVDPEPILIAVESVLPHDVVVSRVPEHVVQAGREEYQRLLRLYKDCTARDSWPGCGADILELTLPAWAAPLDDLFLTAGGKELVF